MAITINRMVTIGGLDVSLKVAGVSMVGGEERSGATGSVMGVGNDPALSLGINSQYARLMFDCQEFNEVHKN